MKHRLTALVLQIKPQALQYPAQTVSVRLWISLNVQRLNQVEHYRKLPGKDVMVPNINLQNVEKQSVPHEQIRSAAQLTEWCHTGAPSTKTK